MRDRPGTKLITLLLVQLVVGVCLLFVSFRIGVMVLSGLAGQLIVIVPIVACVLIREAWLRRRERLGL